MSSNGKLGGNGKEGRSHFVVVHSRLCGRGENFRATQFSQTPSLRLSYPILEKPEKDKPRRAPYPSINPST